MEYLIFLGCLIAIIIIAKLFSWPLKLLFKLGLNVILGGILLYILNMFGSIIGLTINLNWITALIAGTLGIPGVILIILLQFLL